MRRVPTRQGGFTLVEILVVVAVTGILVAIALPSIQGAITRAHSTECASNLRAIGLGINFYSLEHHGEFPRSFHSGGTHGQPGWTASIYPYLSGGDEELDVAGFERYFRCPDHRETNPYVFSYGLNVHFELDPNGDDYTGSPATWRKASQVPKPSKTILVGETRPVLFGDHLMCHQWSSTETAKNALAKDRHRGKPSFLFVDGHVENLKPEQTLNPSKSLNLWNPSLAR
ncbi:MAG: prepilin-type N-terminal cleavage/methylation domain-containing protein [Terrimicrobiaceae bacterium]